MSFQQRHYSGRPEHDREHHFANNSHQHVQRSEYDRGAPGPRDGAEPASGSRRRHSRRLEQPSVPGITKTHFKTREELERSNPTLKDDVEPAIEARWRRSYVKLIQEAGKAVHMYVPGGSVSITQRP